jgi:hypothetical protein
MLFAGALKAHCEILNQPGLLFEIINEYLAHN